jgi:hypothetical protein
MARLLLQVVMEMKPDRLIEKIKIAETAISQRLRNFEGIRAAKRESVALYDAIQTLRNLKSVLIDAGNLEN